MPEHNTEDALHFHCNTQHTRATITFAAMDKRKYLALNQRKKIYGEFPTIQLLTNPAQAQEQTLSQTLLTRQSDRIYKQEKPSFEQISTLFSLAAKVRDQRTDGFSFRTWPSAGGLYPLDCFLLALNIDHVPAGIHYYDPFAHSLMQISGDHVCHPMIDATLGAVGWGHTAAFFIYFTADFDKTLYKYGNRGYRYMLLDAGHLAQNFSLVATSIGLGTCGIGGFYEQEIDSMLGLNSSEEGVLYALAGGIPDQQDFDKNVAKLS